MVIVGLQQAENIVEVQAESRLMKGIVGDQMRYDTSVDSGASYDLDNLVFEEGDMEWINLCMVGTLRDQFDIATIQQGFLKMGVSCTACAWNGRRIVVRFESKEVRNQLLVEYWSYFEDWFSSLEEFDWQRERKELKVRVSLVNVPLHLWHPKFFQLVAEKWGRFICLDEATKMKSNLELASFMLSVECSAVIPRYFEVRVQGRGWKIGVMVDEWVSVGCNNEVDAMSESDRSSSVWRWELESGEMEGLSVDGNFGERWGTENPIFEPVPSGIGCLPIGLEVAGVGMEDASRGVSQGVGFVNPEVDIGRGGSLGLDSDRDRLNPAGYEELVGILPDGPVSVEIVTSKDREVVELHDVEVGCDVINEGPITNSGMLEVIHADVVDLGSFSSNRGTKKGKRGRKPGMKCSKRLKKKGKVGRRLQGGGDDGDRLLGEEVQGVRRLGEVQGSGHVTFAEFISEIETPIQKLTVEQEALETLRLSKELRVQFVDDDCLVGDKFRLVEERDRVAFAET